ncbi:MAG TPA: DUF2254 domain-containing protein, partial [Alphaproteobacteria bacterium]|nr:DUF2254 domain-containing protein [Alphaproteobacteria bacterium]
MRIFSKANRMHMSPWFVPMVYAVTAILAGMFLPRVELLFFPHLKVELSIDVAIALYSSIASGMMALTGIVFSLTFLMVQFSATAYSPRLVMWIARDPVLSHALGVFSATFLYAIAALSWLDRGNSRKVLFISAWVVIALLLASVGMFIALIQRIGLLQINRMLLFTAQQGRKVIENLYGEPGPSSGKVLGLRNVKARPTQALLHRGRPQSLQAIDLKTLIQLARQNDARIEVVVAVGDTVLEGMPLLHLFGSDGRVPETQLRRSFALGDERTFEQDPKYAMRLLVDIAIRALSPAINDPTTAVQALDQIGDLLARLGQRRLEIGEFQDDAGSVRVVAEFPSWDDFLHLGFEEIRAYGAKSVQIMRRMKALVADLLAVLPVERHAALKYWRERLKTSIGRSFENAEEKISASAE